MFLVGYTVHDKKALTYGPPFWQATDGVAVRMFQELANDRSSTVGRHPADFALYRVGSYDDSTGALVGVQPEFVVDAISLVQAAPALPLSAAAE